MFLTDHFIRVAGLQTRYWSSGDKGMPILLVHGLCSSVEWWVNNLKELATRHRVIALDLPGFGRSERYNGRLSPELAVDFIKQFMEAVQFEKVHLVGNSLGGYFSAIFAASYPELVERLVLVSPVGFERQVHWLLRLIGLPLIGKRLASPRKLILKFFHRNFIHRDPSWMSPEWLARHHELSSLPGVSEVMHGVVRTGLGLNGVREEYTKSLHKISNTLKVPTLIVWGDKDRLVPVAHANIANQLIPNSKVYIYKNCGHCPQLERAEEFNKLILEFLNSSTAS